jgi:hypothetical protein
LDLHPDTVPDGRLHSDGPPLSDSGAIAASSADCNSNTTGDPDPDPNARPNCNSVAVGSAFASPSSERLTVASARRGLAVADLG